MKILNLEIPAQAASSYEIHIGAGLLSSIAAQLKELTGSRRPYWIWDRDVWSIWRRRAEQLGWPSEGSEQHLLFAGDEANKRLSSVEDLARELVRRRADRSSVLVAVGGGVTGDVVGFLAAVYMRGIAVYQIPTTLLAQVDSSVGGKTGVDLPEGKNLIGSFHQPRAVWMDPELLTTLPPEQFRQGMAEVIKTALLGDAELWRYLEHNTERIKASEADVLVKVVESCCRVKAAVVADDERESGRRRILNLGHTVGHAIESLSEYHLAHGDAVALGMIVAAAWAVRLEILHPDILERLEALCKAWELPVRIPAHYTPEAIVNALQSDKKQIAGRIHFILPIAVGNVVDRTDLDLGQLLALIPELTA